MSTLILTRHLYPLWSIRDTNQSHLWAFGFKCDIANIHLDGKQGLARKACQPAPVPAKRQTNARIPPGPG